MIKAVKYVLCASMALVTIAACSAEPDTSVKSSGSGLHVGTVAASKGTAARFKITRWHVIEQKDANTLVIDGSDSTGKVRFSASLKDDGTTLTASSYALRGTFVLDKSTLTVKENTLGYDFARTVNAFLLDRARAGSGYALSTKGTALVKKLLSRKGAIKAAKKSAANAKAAAAKKRSTAADAVLKKALDKLGALGGGGAGSPAAQQKAAGAQKKADSAKAKADKAQKDADEANKDEKDDENADKEKDKEEQDAEQKELDQETKENAEEDKEEAAEDRAVAEEDKADESLTDEEKAESEQDAAESQAEADESAEDADGVEDAEAEGEAGEESAEDLGEDTAEGEELPDDGGDGSLDDGGGFDDGGGDEAAESTGSCKKTACSKTTRVCICTHY